LRRTSTAEDVAQLITAEKRNIGQFDAASKTMWNFYGTEKATLEQCTRNAAALQGMTRLTLVVGSAAVILLSAALVLWLGRRITGPLMVAVGIARRIARGDLTSEIAVTGKDETGQLLAAVHDMNTGLANVASAVRDGTSIITDASHDIASGNQDLSSPTEQQVSSLEETAAAMTRLTAVVQRNASMPRTRI
jgi:methyl-accepting chemotaxis protein